jgi:hypothetical protein
MQRRSLVLASFLIVLALPLSASQFIDLPFDQVARESRMIVRGTVQNTWTAWDDSHEIIYTYATVRVNRYLGDATGPDTLVVREVGGTLDGYTQEAIGFPMIRANEDVVFFLAPWEDDASVMRIHAFNQGKYLVRQRNGEEIVVPDPVRQGDARREGGGRGFDLRTDSVDDSPALTLNELVTMIEDARGGATTGHQKFDRQ